MRIRPSIRLYVLLAMSVTGISTILVLSALSVHYFVSGMDVSMRVSMYIQASEDLPLSDDDLPIEGFVVAEQWQDLPQKVQDSFHEEDIEFDVLSKHVVGATLFSPPKSGHFVMKVGDDDNFRYVTTTFNTPDKTLFRMNEIPHFLIIFITALGCIALFSAILLLVMRRITRPVEQLKTWAKDLNQDKLNQVVPDFHYSELNTLATIIQSSLGSVQESLEREQKFLGYASHELRTPIAVTRTNCELLEKLIIKGMSPSRQLDVLERIKRAGFTMTNLTETLLWLTRQESKQLPENVIQLGAVVAQINQDLEYMLVGKKVDVRLQTDDSKASLPEGLCRIVIVNLVRNAFQHTQEGHVEIKQDGCRVSIVNHNVSDNEEDSHLGFGLGLELTERLVGQYNWFYQNEQKDSGHAVVVNFNENEH